MAEPFLGELRIMSFSFPPKGWARADGQLLPINQNQALFSLLGTTFGGDGRVNFRLPDLRARTPIHFGSGHILGEQGGEQSHTLRITEIPTHTHTLSAVSTGSVAGNQVNGAGASLVTSTPNNIYSNSSPNIALNQGTLSQVGGSQAHLNMQPFLTLNFCIALQGIFPSQN
jgi:microcystin-dependent protein